MELTIEESEGKQQTQFENIQHQTIVQVVSVREKLQSYQNYQSDEPEQTPQIKLDFLQGNPILPPGKYHLRQQPNFRLKFMSMRQKFNKTSLDNAGKSMRSLKKDLSVKQDDKMQKQWQDTSQDFEYLTLLQTKKLVYKRINNCKINNIGKERLLCSVFYDWKKQRIVSKQESLLQHLSKNRNLKVEEPQVDWLSFSSNFQSGNLLMAFKNPISSMPTYELYMMNDINTKGCTQWYYFSATSKSRGKAKIRLMNFYKPTSLYQKGMKVLVSYDGLDWKRTGTSIVYGRSSIDKSQYSLDFIHDFEIPGKQIFFAYGFPYTYSFHLTSYINTISNELKFQKIFHRSVICNSTLGNPVYMLYISNFSAKKQVKPLVYIIGRQHPGETPASYIVQGLVSFLLSNSNQAKQLRQSYQFRIVPMVNVDGVINGNYRSNVSGLDINRQWQFPSKKGQPEVFWLKNQINNNRKNTAFFLDIHAHSRKMNSFFYGSKIVNKQNKLYPFLCSKLNKYISYSDSSFNDDPSKKTTARVVLQNQLLIPHSLTFQVSFYGWTDPQKQSNYSFKQSDLRNMGQSLGLGFYYTFIGIEKARQVKNSTLPKCMTEKEKVLMKNSVKLLQKWNKQLDKESNQQTDDNFSEGSSLNPQHFQLKQQQKFMISQMMKIKMLEKAQDKNTKNHSAPKQGQSSSRKKFLVYSTLNPSEMSHQQSKLLAPREIPTKSNLGISSNQFYHFSSTAKGPKKQPFSVRELELQLQLCGQISPQKKLRGIKLRMGQQNQLITGLDRYQSLDIDRQKNYKNDVLQMKKALKYLLQTKSSDYQQYKSCFKSFNNQLLGMQKTSRYYK